MKEVSTWPLPGRCMVLPCNWSCQWWLFISCSVVQFFVQQLLQIDQDCFTLLVGKLWVRITPAAIFLKIAGLWRMSLLQHYCCCSFFACVSNRFIWVDLFCSRSRSSACPMRASCYSKNWCRWVLLPGWWYRDLVAKYDFSDDDIDIVNSSLSMTSLTMISWLNR